MPPYRIYHPTPPLFPSHLHLHPLFRIKTIPSPLIQANQIFFFKPPSCHQLSLSFRWHGRNAATLPLSHDSYVPSPSFNLIFNPRPFTRIIISSSNTSAGHVAVCDICMLHTLYIRPLWKTGGKGWGVMNKGAMDLNIDMFGIDRYKRGDRRRNMNHTMKMPRIL